MIALFIIGVVLLLELLAALIYAGKSASGLTWVICRPFLIPMPMFLGFIVRLVLIGFAVFCLTKSIPVIF
jgi:hypothetical protein